MLSWVFLTSILHDILSRPLTAFQYNHCQNNRQDREMNSVTITIINPRKEFWPRWRFEPATSCSQVFYATDRYGGSALNHRSNIIIQILYDIKPKLCFQYKISKYCRLTGQISICNWPISHCPTVWIQYRFVSKLKCLTLYQTTKLDFSQLKAT